MLLSYQKITEKCRSMKYFDRVFNIMVIPGANCLIPFLLLLVCGTQSINKIA
jgi:hypothetical protein